MIQHNSRKDADGIGGSADIGQKSAKAYDNTTATTVNQATETPLTMALEKWDDDTMHSVVTDTDMLEFTSTADELFPEFDPGGGWIWFLVGGGQLTNITPDRCYVATQLTFPSTIGFIGAAWEASENFFRGTFCFQTAGDENSDFRHLSAYHENAVAQSATRKTFAIFAIRITG